MTTYVGLYSPPNTGMGLERNFSLALSIINPEKSFENHKTFHPENY